MLQCEQDLILSLTEMLLDTGIGITVGLVAFSSDAIASDLDVNTTGVQVFADPSDPEIEATVLALTRGGGTSFLRATRVAIDVVTEASQNQDATQSFVVFLSDGLENGVSNLDTEIAALQALGATVFSFAVEANSMCINNLVRLADDPAGECNEVIMASELALVINEVIFPQRNLTDIAVTLSNSPILFTANPAIPVLELSSDSTPRQVSIDNLNTLGVGAYKLRLQSAAGNDTATRCLDFSVTTVL